MSDTVSDLHNDAKEAEKILEEKRKKEYLALYKKLKEQELKPIVGAKTYKTIL